MTNRHTSETYALLLPTFNAARNRWEVPSANGTPGNYLFTRQEDARRFHAAELDRLRNHEKRTAEQAAAQAKAEEERAAYLASFRGFLPADPMRAGRILQTLERRHIYRGEVRTRKQTVELLVSEGRTLTEDGLQDANGAFLTVCKTARAYAAHLIALRESERAA